MVNALNVKGSPVFFFFSFSLGLMAAFETGGVYYY